MVKLVPAGRSLHQGLNVKGKIQKKNVPVEGWYKALLKACNEGGRGVKGHVGRVAVPRAGVAYRWAQEGCALVAKH